MKDLLRRIPAVNDCLLTILRDEIFAEIPAGLLKKGIRVVIALLYEISHASGLLIPRAYLLIGKIDEQTGAAYFLVYFLDEKIGKIDEKV